MKILVLCYEYPPVGGGGGRIAERLSESLASRGHSVRVLTAGMKHLPDSETRNDVNIVRTQSFRKREDTCTVPEMILYLLTNFWSSLQNAREWKPDLIHVHFAVPSGALALAIHHFTKIPYVLTAHLGDVPGGVPEQTDRLFRFVEPFTRPIWRHAAKTTAVSSFVADLAEKAYGIPTEVIPNGVEMRPDPSLSTRPTPRILFVGRLSVQKNPLLALRALALLKDIPWHLDIAGEGPLGAEVRFLTDQLGFSERITHHGWQDAKGVAKLMAAADVLLMPSLHEGLPMAAIEAMQNGLALVGSRIGGLMDVIEHEKNGLFSDLNERDFAEKLRLLLVNPEFLLKMRLASLEKVRAFDLDVITSAYERVFFDAIERRGA